MLLKHDKCQSSSVEKFESLINIIYYLVNTKRDTKMGVWALTSNGCSGLL